jgi:hypothetical protein
VPFAFKVGIKCAAECPPDGWTLEVRDHQGTTLATGAVSEQRWQGTVALFYAEFEIRSPDAVGQFDWEVVAPAVNSVRPDRDRDELRHDQVSAHFKLRTVPQGECKLTLLAIDRASERPVPGLKVVVHPYRTMTDAQGLAELLLPKGSYRLFVSGKNFFPLRLDGELAADLQIRAELEVDREPTDAELWS